MLSYICIHAVALLSRPRLEDLVRGIERNQTFINQVIADTNIFANQEENVCLLSLGVVPHVHPLYLFPLSLYCYLFLVVVALDLSAVHLLCLCSRHRCLFHSLSLDLSFMISTGFVGDGEPGRRGLNQSAYSFNLCESHGQERQCTVAAP